MSEVESEQSASHEPFSTVSPATGEPLYWARDLQDRHLRHARLVPNRERLLDFLEQGAIVAEVGTYEGDFARVILDRTHPLELHLIDLRYDAFRRRRFDAELESGQLQLHRGDSAEVLAEFTDGHFDWIYIDGDHSYDGVRRDIAVAVEKVRPDGLLVFNDFTSYSPMERRQYGVMRAVVDLCLEREFEIVFFALQGLGYHDVALRRIRAGW